MQFNLKPGVKFFKTYPTHAENEVCQSIVAPILKSKTCCVAAVREMWNACCTSSTFNQHNQNIRNFSLHDFEFFL